MAKTRDFSHSKDQALKGLTSAPKLHLKTNRKPVLKRLFPLQECVFVRIPLDKFYKDKNSRAVKRLNLVCLESQLLEG